VDTYYRESGKSEEKRERRKGKKNRYLIVNS
jgi:hypothetical protein